MMRLDALRSYSHLARDLDSLVRDQGLRYRDAMAAPVMHAAAPVSLLHSSCDSLSPASTFTHHPPSRHPLFPSLLIVTPRIRLASKVADIEEAREWYILPPPYTHSHPQTFLTLLRFDTNKVALIIKSLAGHAPFSRISSSHISCNHSILVAFPFI